MSCDYQPPASLPILAEYLVAGVAVEFAGEEIGGLGCAAAEQLPCGVRVGLRAEVIVAVPPLWWRR